MTLLYSIILVLEVIIAVVMVGIVLLQKSEGGALGMGGGGMSGFMTGRSTANLLTRTTAIAAILFFVACVSLDWIASHQRLARNELEVPNLPRPAAPAAPAAPAPSGGAPAPGAPAPAAPAAPAEPATPAAPLPK
jgi:preprotein translocase subunit SecG